MHGRCRRDERERRGGRGVTVSDPELKEEIRRRHGVDLPDELLGVLADPR